MNLVEYIKNTNYKILNKQLVENATLVEEINNQISADIPLRDKITLLRKGFLFMPTCIICGKSVQILNNYVLKTCNDTKCKSSFKSTYTKQSLSNVDWQERNKKIKSTNIKKIGCEWPTQNNKIKSKIKDSILEKYGVTNVFQNEDIKLKIKKSFIEKYNVDNYSKTDESKNKIKETCNLKYGSYSYLGSEKRKIDFNKKNILNLTNKLLQFNCQLLEFDKTIKLNKVCIKCNNCNTESILPISSFNLRLRNNITPCLTCEQPYKNGDPTIAQKEVLEYIKSIYTGDILQNYGKNNPMIFDRKEVDLYLKDKNIAIEFNGLYWHSEKYKDKNYHINKKKLVENKNIKLIQIWSDDWYLKQDIIKSRLKNLLGKNEFVYGAREFKLQKIEDLESIKNFLNENHLQGFSNASVYYGLVKNNEIFSLASFKKNKDKYELKRFATKQNYTIKGALPRFIKYFYSEFPNSKLYTYSDLDWSPLENSIYEKIGFKKIKTTVPSYFWIINGVKIHRQQFMKHKLIDIQQNETESDYMHKKGYFRLFNCGNNLYEYKQTINNVI